ncbi:MAG: iron-containing alcohol dehydrogenase, partial [Actinobacteria bacterium]|nr:iron-containing alcohol dehydrogenase [Actinomycetota bacterium]
MNCVTVDLGDRTYDVIVGHGARSEAASLLPPTAKRVAIVTQAGIPVTLIPDFPQHQVSVHEIGVGEEFKSLSTIQSLCSAFAQAGLTRNDVVVGVGGGMVTDIAGFAAASYHRGIPVVHVATSLLAMIDAAV